MTGEDLLRIGASAKVRHFGKVYLILTTHRFMLVGKKSMKDFLLRDITNVGWIKKKKIRIQTTNNDLTVLKGKRKWRRTYDEFLRAVREQQLGFGVGKPAHIINQEILVVQRPAQQDYQPSQQQPSPPPPDETTQNQRPMFCPKCGKPSEGNTFCKYCGAKIG
jgi:hypothetical protein